MSVLPFSLEIINIICLSLYGNMYSKMECRYLVLCSHHGITVTSKPHLMQHTIIWKPVDISRVHTIKSLIYIHLMSKTVLSKENTIHVIALHTSGYFSWGDIFIIFVVKRQITKYLPMKSCESKQTTPP